MNILLIAAVGALTRVTPINPAEAVFAPFWDSGLKEIRQWHCSRGKLSPYWCITHYSWDRQPESAGTPAFEAVRNEPFSCTGYDTFIYAGSIPPQAKLRISLETDKGLRSGEWTGKSAYRDEYPVPLAGAEKISRIKFQVFDTGRNQIRKGHLLWMGLQNSAELKRLLDQRKSFASQPLDRFLAPKGTVPAFKGTVNLLAPAAELEKIQDAYLKRKKALGRDFITVPGLDSYHPETMYNGILPFANLRMFARVRDEGQKFRDVQNLIVKALITRNREIMDKAVRTALVMALTPNWDSSFLSVFLDSGWDQRVFGNVRAAEYLSLVLDYAGDMLSDAGRELLAKRLALEGLGQINYNIWKYRYLFGNNQLAVFTRGRISAYLVLEKLPYWNGVRVKPYTELAMAEFFDSVGKLFHEDGSFMEGPAYFCYTVRHIRPVLEMYACARNKPLAEIIPPRLKNLGRFGDVFISTDRRGGLIPVSSGQGPGRTVSPELCQFLALLAPDSQWVDLYHRQTGNQAALWNSDLTMIARHPQVPAGPVKVRSLAELPAMGVMASTRFFEGEPVKILLVGTPARMNQHRHNDRGSFVLEFAGDTYAADPGGQIYAEAGSSLVRRSDYHNMLVPGDMPDNEPEMTSRADVFPRGKGDAKSFSAEILPAPSSYDYFTEWKRTIQSPVPNRFLFRDEYHLTPNRKSARFLWITELPWKKIEDGMIRLDGKNSYALLRYPKELHFYAEQLTVRRKEIYHRLNFEKKAPAGIIEIQVEFHKKTGMK